MWLIYAFGSALFAGLTAILAKIGVKNTDFTLATALRTGIVLAFSWLMVFIAGSEHTIGAISARTALFLVLSGMATGASWLCYFKALQLGSVSKVTPVDKSSTILSVLLAFLLLGETPTPLGIVGLVLLGAGTFLMIKKQATEPAAAKGGSWLFYAVLSAVFAALTSILGKVGIQGIDSTLGTAIRTIVVLVMAWGMVFLQKNQGAIKELDRKSWLFIALSGLATGLSWLCYYRALQDGDVSVVVPIDKLSIVLTILFSRVALEETIVRRALFGLLLVVAGTVLLLF